MRKSGWVISLVGLLLLAALPVLGRWARHAPQDRCALDGVVIVPVYQVRVNDAVGKNHVFCCVRCAGIWLSRQASPPQAIWVTDESRGGEFEASGGYFVRSSIVTTPTTGNRIHVFAREADAERHAQIAHGRMLRGPEPPFAAWYAPDP